MNPKTDWFKKWHEDTHIESRKNRFKEIDKWLKKPPQKILDIGCGLSREGEYFQKKYGCELYLLDGEPEHGEPSRSTQYGSVTNFAYYNTIEDLKKSYNERGMVYTFIDAKCIDIDDNIKFDLIMSNLSCGFHYPAITYRDLVKKHSQENTNIIFDIRHNSKQENDIIIKEIISRNQKHIKASIAFK